MALAAADPRTTIAHDEWAATARTLRAFVARRVRAVDVDDVTQDILVRVLRTARNGDVGSTPAWLFTVARNAVIDHYRTRRTMTPLPPDVADRPEDAPTEGPHAALEELARCLRPAVDQLPEPYRRALVMVDLDGMTQVAAAAAEGISVSGMKSRVQRGRRMLRTRLSEWCGAHLDATGRVAGCTDCGCVSPADC